MTLRILPMMTALCVAFGALISSAASKDFEKTDPASVGLDPAGMARLSTDMKAFVDQNRRAGVVYAVMRQGKLVALEAFGSRNIEKNLPMTTDTAFRLYSQSRAVTAAAILTLLDEGKLKLDDPVAKYIPEIAKMQVIKEIKDGQVVATEPQKTPMTIRHLFTYTSGLGYAADWPKSVGMNQRDILSLDGDLALTMSKLSRYPLLTQPGERWIYGFSSDVLGRVAEVASGQKLNLFLKNRLFDKIGMTGTDFWVKDPDMLAEVYGPDVSGPNAPNALMRKASPASSTYTKPGTLFSAGGGLVSTATDYLRFMQMLLNGGTLDGVRVLKPETVKMMLTRQTTPQQGLVYWYNHNSSATFRGYAWGLGIGIRAAEGPHTIPGSDGDAAWGGLANTTYFIDPKQQIVAVALSQYLGDDAEALALTLRNGVYSAIQH
ncbi:MAG: beta-lactamase family protein [Rhodospirillaceae bacterium]|nr:beta-lactamase family protein [Rhodospirillaceae bacterium]